MSAATTDDVQGIEDLIARLVRAWDRGDAEAYGAEFAEDATYITFLGTLYRGRRDIIESHRALFKGFLKGTRMFGETVEIRFVSPDNAIVIMRGDVGKKAPKTLSKVQTFTVVRREGRWVVVAFHNTQRSRLKEAIGFRFAPATRPSR